MAEHVNPLLLKVKLPGRFFSLPSRGALYTTELDPTVKNGEIQVQPMSALAEINLKNPDLLFNGKALPAVLQECVPLIKEPLELFGRDVDAILFFLRLVTYGTEYVIQVSHNCPDAKQHDYRIDLEAIVNDMKVLDPSTVETKRIVRLTNDQIVYIRPIKFKDIIELFQNSANKKELSVKDIQELAVTNLLSIIEKVDDTTDKKDIEEWVRSLTTPQVNRITDAAAELNDWGPSQTVNLKCKDCQEQMKVELPLNPVSFFTE